MSIHILTLIGPDRPGLVQELSSAAESVGGNWRESRLARLGGRFVGLVEMDLDAARVGGLRELLEAWRGEGFECVLQEAAVADKASDAAGILWELDAQGNDRPGIVSAVARAIRLAGGNVEELETTVHSAPMAGGDVFRMFGVVRTADEEAADRLATEIELLGLDLAVDLHRMDA